MGTGKSGQRLLVIHAGTHKTASSYIQSCMAANRSLLRRSGVLIEYPSLPAHKHKPLADALDKRQWEYWENYIKNLSREEPLVLISAEQFTQIIVKTGIRRQLTALLEKEGFQLGVAVFLRDQPDYINSRYVHSVRRFYHAQNFDGYVQDQLADRKHIYNYNRLFFGLATDSSTRTFFLPYGRELGDPFDRLLSALGIQTPPGGWQAADPSKTNIQPGFRAVWLAQQITEQLHLLGVNSRSLVNTGDVVRRIAMSEGWLDDRYCGFNEDSASAVVDHYARSNHRFARRVWGCEWRQVVPEVSMRRTVYIPPDPGPEQEHMDDLVILGLRDLARENLRLRWTLWQRSALSMIPVIRE
jgi:hypothetical protein